MEPHCALKVAKHLFKNKSYYHHKANDLFGLNINNNMKKVLLSLMMTIMFVSITEATPKDTIRVAQTLAHVTSADALPGDGTLRFYRLAIPVTKSAYDEDLESSYDKVKAIWQECEQ